ncbi:hypothetical protein C8Q80DRAFT_1273071 [Daedaleopsis nitida]|nr:hypothetical protein C8Q80DRAFT_1273071 [Daedaleopsis nitida]
MSALVRARLDSDSEGGEEHADDDINASEPGDEARGLLRDGDFWFDDGSIILHARDVVFKVYARPLIEHSPVFEDMLSLPQPDVDADTGSAGRRTPVVLLHDSPEDLRHVFEIAHRVGKPGLAHGLPREDGTMERLCRPEDDLCSESWKNLVDARAELAQRLFTIANIDWDECEREDPWDLCTDAIEGTLLDLELCFLPGLYTPRPLDCLMSEYADSKHLVNLCKSCRTQLVDFSKAERRKSFYRLPSLLGITVDGWGNSRARGGNDVRRK